MKETRNLLMSIFFLAIAIALGIVIVYETDMMETGLLAEDKNSEFLLTSTMELLTLGSVFLALRLFKFNVVHSQLVAQKASALSKWGTLRLLLLMVPMVVNTLLYYLFMNPTFGYMAIIQLLCLPFVFPSMNRCQAEVEEA
jgi:hypothetical protein